MKYQLMCLSILLALLAFTCGDYLEEIDFENGVPHKTGEAVSEETFRQTVDGYGWKRMSTIILSADRELNDKDFYSVYPDADSYEFHFYGDSITLFVFSSVEGRLCERTRSEYLQDDGSFCCGRIGWVIVNHVYDGLELIHAISTRDGDVYVNSKYQKMLPSELEGRYRLCDQY